MKLWALSDLHLSFNDAIGSEAAKPMHIFGEHWRKHWLKIAANWEKIIQPQDVVLLPGDISWANNMNHAYHDLFWVSQLTGALKIIVPGNHDRWWPPENQFKHQPHSLKLLRGTAILHQGLAFCGTCGWLAPQDPYSQTDDKQIFQQELDLLKQSLQAAVKLQPPDGIHVLLHFPPWDSQGKPTPLDNLIRQYPVRSITYGHFHFLPEWERAPKGWHQEIFYTLASADFLDFTPAQLPFSVSVHQ